ncbi:MAG: MFS transporter, partial [Spirochaetaceae bacterium]|nr:MFS transporter [Spirochaetaceae bacterium]
DTKIPDQFGFVHDSTLPETPLLRNCIHLAHSIRYMVPFKKLPKNARTCIVVEPLWALFGPMATYYMSLYQKAMGLSEVQMGIVNSVKIAAGFIFFSFASPITNRLGRRKASVAFDLVAWGLTMVIWAFSRSYVWFLVAAITNAAVRVVNVSWNLLLTEDASNEQRPTIYGWVYLAGAFGGITTFLGGLAIERFGLVPSLRTIFIAGAIVMSTMFIVRYIGTRETKIGLLLMEKSKTERFSHSVLKQIPEAAKALKDPFFLRMAGIFVIANAVLSIDFFRVLYLGGQKGLSPFVISIVPALGSVASMAIFFFVLPHQDGRENHQHLAYSFLLCMIFQLVFVFIPEGSVLGAIIAVPGLTASYVLLQTFRDSVFMNATDSNQRSERFSLVQALMLLVSIPMGWLSGYLYSLSPHYPFVLASILYGIGFLLARDLGRYEKTA